MKVLNSGSYSLHGLLSSLFFWLQNLLVMVMFACIYSLNMFAFIHYLEPFLSLYFFSVVFSVIVVRKCEEIYGYFTILLEQLSMFIGGVGCSSWSFFN